MTAKEKAIELVKKFSKHAKYWDCYHDVPLEEEHDKQCALIAVDELIKECVKQSVLNHGVDDVDYGQSFWQEVKQEIEKL